MSLLKESNATTLTAAQKKLRRQEIVRKTLRLKLEQGHPDIGIWQQAARILESLSLDAMSSEDEAIVMVENVPVKAFFLWLKQWDLLLIK